MFELREYQREIVNKAKAILLQRKIVYIAAQVRTGKSPISITIAKECGWKRVCIFTRKNAISGILKFTSQEAAINWTVTNFEQAKNITGNFDGFIIDEAHNLGAFPKPSQRTKILKTLIQDKPIILLSGTPSAESRSQLYHQFWISQYGPFKEFFSFYRWAKEYVIVRQKKIGGFFFNDYSETKESFVDMMVAPYMITLTQEEAGFTSFVEEEILTVQIDERLYKCMEVLKKQKIYKMKNGETIVCDTPVKMQSVFHQLSSGSIKIDEKRFGIDESKAWFIRGKFAGMKIGIFFKFIAEGDILRKVFPNHTDDPELFNKYTDLVYIKQMTSGKEGSNLSSADALVMYNIDFSATTYWQVRARMQELNRIKPSKLYWIFSEKGLERFVYKAVVKKQDYTNVYFKKDLKMIGYSQLEIA